MTFGFTELEQSNGSSTCEAFCWDLETNTKRAYFARFRTFGLENARAELSDPRDIYELVANRGGTSRRVPSMVGTSC